jgi:hypothetical protein
MRHRPPGLSAGLAALMRSMPTAAFEIVKSPPTCVDTGELAEQVERGQGKNGFIFHWLNAHKSMSKG